MDVSKTGLEINNKIVLVKDRVDRTDRFTALKKMERTLVLEV